MSADPALPIGREALGAGIVCAELGVALGDRRRLSVDAVKLLAPVLLLVVVARRFLIVALGRTAVIMIIVIMVMVMILVRAVFPGLMLVNLVRRSEVIVDSDAQNVIFRSRSRDEIIARAIGEELRLQLLIEVKIFEARRPAVGDRIGEAGADREFHARGLRGLRDELCVKTWRRIEKLRGPARAAGCDAARHIGKPGSHREAGASANGREVRAARTPLQRIGRRRGEAGAVRRVATAEIVELGLEAIDEAPILPVVSGMSAGGDATRLRQNMRIEIVGWRKPACHRRRNARHSSPGSQRRKRGRRKVRPSRSPRRQSS